MYFIGHLGPSSGFSNFLRLYQNVNSLGLLTHVSENSSQKGPVVDSPYLQALALNSYSVFLPGSFSTGDTGDGVSG